MTDIINYRYLNRCGGKVWQGGEHIRVYFDQGYYDVKSKKWVGLTDDKITEIKELYKKEAVLSLQSNINEQKHTKEQLLEKNPALIKLIDAVEDKTAIRFSGYKVKFLNFVKDGKNFTFIKYETYENGHACFADLNSVYVLREGAWGV